MFWWNAIGQYMTAISIFLLLSFLFWLLHRYVFVWADKTIKKYKERRRGTYAVAHALLTIPRYVLFIFALYISLQFLSFSDVWYRVLSSIFLIFLVFWFSNVLSTFFTVLIGKFSYAGDQKSLDMTKNVVKLVIKILLWIVALLLLLINFGIEITPFLASLWIGWIAIAFALQNILQDIFASFSIFIEKPFSLWDFIVLWETRWTISHISFKSTYIEALEWQVIVVPNKEVMNSKIENYGVMKRRWHKQTIWIVYQTSPDSLKHVVNMIQEEIDAIENITYHRAHIRSLNSYSIDIEFAYYIESKEMLFFLDKNQELLISILARFAREGVTIAYPTQLVYTQTS
jgi:small-conductance mechanosensitive channel